MVDTFTAVHFIYNPVSQYGAIVVVAVSEGNATNLARTFLEPITGIGVGYQFIQAPKDAAERRARIATLATLMSASAGTAIGSNPATNAGLGTAIGTHIAHMRNILKIRGGQIVNLKIHKTTFNFVKTPVSDINPYGTKFIFDSKVIIDNMFLEHSNLFSL